MKCEENTSHRRGKDTFASGSDYVYSFFFCLFKKKSKNGSKTQEHVTVLTLFENLPCRVLPVARCCFFVCLFFRQYYSVLFFVFLSARKDFLVSHVGTPSRS